MSARVLRLEQLFAALVEPPELRFEPVVMYDAAAGPPQRPANAPEGARWIAIPDNHRDRPLEDEIEEVATEPASTEPQVVEPLTWKRYVF